MSYAARWNVTPILLTVFVTVGSLAHGDTLWLVEDGMPRVNIVGCGEDDYAAERLQRWFSEEAEVEVSVVAPTELRRLPKDDCVILLGSATSSRSITKLFKEIALELDADKLTEQGYIVRRLRHDGREYVVLAGGGRDGVIHAVADLMNLHLNVSEKGVWIGPLDTREVPKMKYRWFWTWDNRMDWGGAGKIAKDMAGPTGATVYNKKPEAYLTDYKRCIDFMADHKLNGLIIWGFLRDSHGGVEASQELCRYAARRGVRILPGVGTSGYGGYYFQGQHLYSLKNWLRKHPELRAIKKDGTPYMALCPSNPINKKWLDDGAEWLFKTFQIGGVNLEMGDFLVCYCDDCRKARAEIESSEPDYYKDMAISHMVTLKKMRSVSPGAWLSYATYTPYTTEMETDPPKFLIMIPQDSICQWTLTDMAPNWPSDVKPMAKHNIGYLHWCNYSSNTENDFYLQRVRDICRNAKAAGMEGLDTYGELPSDKLNAEIFYLAWEAFLWKPEMTVEEFVETRLGRIYGGAKAASVWLEIIPLIRTQKLREDVKNLDKAIKLAESARNSSSPAGYKRWDKLIGNLKRDRKLLMEH
jgi:hypothetical protein